MRSMQLCGNLVDGSLKKRFGAANLPDRAPPAEPCSAKPRVRVGDEVVVVEGAPLEARRVPADTAP